MTTHRRDFLQRVGIVTAAGLVAPSLLNFNSALAGSLAAANKRIEHLSPEDAAMDEEYWKTIQEAYSVSPVIINLNNGGVSPQPIKTQDMQDRYVRECNQAPSYYMWRTVEMGREPLREKLALLAGCSAEELAINRNSTEALATIIYGLNMEAGDEVVLAQQDYPHMMDDYRHREKRHGIKLVWLDLDLPK